MNHRLIIELTYNHKNLNTKRFDDVISLRQPLESLRYVQNEPSKTVFSSAQGKYQRTIFILQTLPQKNIQ